MAQNVSFANACLNCCQGQFATTQFNPCEAALAVAAGVQPCPRVGPPVQTRYVDTLFLGTRACVDTFPIPAQRRHFLPPSAVSVRNAPFRGFNPGSCVGCGGGRRF